MELDAEEQRRGFTWFFGAGTVAICFALFLIYVDMRLSTSDREEKLGSTLRELRTAQAGLPSRVTDRRQLSFADTEGRNLVTGGAAAGSENKPASK